METGRRVNEIDLLRFLAALAVVFHHYAFRGHAADNLTVLSYPALVPVAKYGYLGVDLFFMISGFVIFMTVSGGTLRHFVVSRVTKLYPAFWICCTITFVVSLVIGGERFPVSVMQYLVNMLCLGGIFGVAAIDGAYWSLHIEMWFYALVAIMLVFGALKRAQLLLWAWLAASVLAIQLHVHAIKSVLIADNAAYFITGAVLYMIWLHGPSASKIALLCASFGGAIDDAINFARAESVHDKTAIDLYVVVAIVTGFFVMMLLVALRRTGALRERRWLMLGAVSYPLYLIHQGIGYMVFNAVSPAINYRLAFWGMIFLALVLAYVVHVCAERPLATSMKRWLNRALVPDPGIDEEATAHDGAIETDCQVGGSTTTYALPGKQGDMGGANV